MTRFVLTVILCALAPLARADDWQTRDGDVRLSQSEMQDLTAGRVLTFYDDGQSKFSVGGSYSYTYADGGGTAFGRFTVEPDGTVCIAYQNGFSRCDLYVRSNGRLVLITQKGERFPVRPE